MENTYMLCPKCRKETLAYDSQSKEYICQLNDSCGYLISEAALKSVCSNDFISDSNEAVLIKLAGMNQRKITIGIDPAKEGSDETVVACHCRARGGGKMCEALTQIAKIDPDRIVIIEAPEPNDQIASIKVARDYLFGLKETQKCTCKGFQRQYDGCSCVNGRQIIEARKKVWELIRAL